MTGLRKAALVAITLLVAAASAASFAESYRADRATRHGLHGVWAYAWPLQVDTFIAACLLALSWGSRTWSQPRAGSGAPRGDCAGCREGALGCGL